MATTAERLTADAYLKREDPRHTELIDGTLVVNQPGALHQRTVLTISATLDAWASGAPDRGMVSLSLDIRLDEHNVLAPDILWFAEPIALTAARAPRVPELVVEIRSASTWSQDIGPKRALYERHGVRELWLVDTASRSVLVSRRAAGDDQFTGSFELAADAELTSPLLPGFSAPVAALIPTG